MTRIWTPSEAAMPGALLPAVLQRVQAEVGEVRGLGMTEDPEDAALVLELVEHRTGPRDVSVYGLTQSPALRSKYRSIARRPDAFGVGQRLVDHDAGPPTDDPDPIAADAPDRRRRDTRRRRQRQQLGRSRSAPPTRRPATPTRRTASPRRRTPPAPADDRGDVDVDAERRVEAALGERHRQAALGAVVRRPDQPAGRALDQQRAAAPPRASRSSAGGTPRTRPCITFRYSLPPSSSRLSPSRTTTSPAALERPPHDACRHPRSGRRRRAPASAERRGRRSRCRG